MPTSILDTVRAALRRLKPTTTQLAEALTTARSAEKEARDEVERLSAVIAAGFMEDAGKRAADRAALAAAREAVEDAVAIVAETERRHAAALVAEEQARRRGLYESARTRADEAAAALAKAYPRLVKDAHALLRDLATAQQDVAVANAALPAGADALIDPEARVRGAGYRPRETISDRVVELWVRFDSDQPVAEPVQSEIRATRHGRGRHKNDDLNEKDVARGVQRGADDLYLRARFRRLEYRDAVLPEPYKPLAIALRLPALIGQGMAWGETFLGGIDQDLPALMHGNAAPLNVLTRLEQCNAAPPARPTTAETPIKVDFELLGYVDAVPLKPAPHQTYGAADGQDPNRMPTTPARPIDMDLIGLPSLTPPGRGASPFGSRS